MCSMVFIGSGSSHFFIRTRIQGNDTDSTDPQHWAPVSASQRMFSDYGVWTQAQYHEKYGRKPRNTLSLLRFIRKCLQSVELSLPPAGEEVLYFDCLQVKKKWRLKLNTPGTAFRLNTA